MGGIFEEYNRKHDDFEFVISTPREYLAAIKDTVQFPVWQGDRNPVFQGCYSARIAVKQWNRQLETTLQNAEQVDAAAALLTGSSRAAAIDRAWEGVLFNQFHDIICGSHVDRVYANVIDRFKSSDAAAAACLEASLETVLEAIDTSGDGIPIVVFNTLSWDRDDVAECRIGFSEQNVMGIDVQDSAGNRVQSDLVACERYSGGGIKRATVLFIARNVPAAGYEVYRIVRSESDPIPSTLTSNQPDFLMAEIHRDVIENEFYRVEIDAWNGAILSLFDKSISQDVIPVGRPYGGTVVRELDNGNFWEYNGHCKGDALLPMNRSHPLPAEGDSRAAFSHHFGGDGRISNGRARTEYSVGFAFGKGYFATRIRLYAGLPRIDIHTSLINEDERVRYRMALPTSIEEGIITHEIPFGAIDRPAGEFAAQHWVDYGDGERGVGVLNRGLPGNGVHDGVMMLSLMKCTALKEGYGEVGGYSSSTKTTDGYELGVRHEFDYALVPHAGDWRAAKMVRRGMEFNRPLMLRKTGAHNGRLPQRMSFWRVSADNVEISAVRGTAAGTVVRVYETEGTGARGVTLNSGFSFGSVEEVNLIEKEPRPISGETDGRSFSFDIGPFEIRTFRLDSASAPVS